MAAFTHCVAELATRGGNPNGSR